MTIADPKEVKAFLDKHPEIQFFEIVFTNLAGVPRGKRLRRHEIEAVYANGRFLPVGESSTIRFASTRTESALFFP